MLGVLVRREGEQNVQPHALLPRHFRLDVCHRAQVCDALQIGLERSYAGRLRASRIHTGRVEHAEFTVVRGRCSGGVAPRALEHGAQHVQVVLV